MIVISDTSVVSNLIDIQHLFLLERLYGKVLIPQAVYRELSVVESFIKEISQPWIEVCAVEEPLAVEIFQRNTRLDKGESEAILLAQRLNADFLLIDERRGRAEAQRLGIRITGLLGILVDGKKQAYISAVKPLMDQLIASSAFRISPELYQMILVMAVEN